MYVFAGAKRKHTDSTPNTVFSDLFRYDLAADSWTELTGHTATRTLHAAVWDSTSSRMRVYGGQAEDSTLYSDVLEYDALSDTWTSPTVSGNIPRARTTPLAAFDSTSGLMLMCCGRGTESVYIPFTDMSDTRYNDVWSYADGSWTELQSASFVQRENVNRAVWDPTTRSMLGYGGTSAYTGEGDIKLATVFSYSITMNTSIQYTVSGTGPGTKTQTAAAWNPDAAEFYMFGGKGSGGTPATFWRLGSTHTHISHQYFHQ